MKSTITAKNIICGQEVKVTILGKYSNTQTEVRYNNKNFVVSNTDLTNNIKEKFTSKIEYTVDREIDDKTGEVLSITRWFEMTVTAKNEDVACKIWDDFATYFSENSNVKTYASGCPAIDEYRNGNVSYWDTMPVFDKEEYEEVKALYTEWKKLYK